MAKLSSSFPFQEVDDFSLQELIYESAHTLVFRGFQSNLNRAVLIKLLKPQIKERKEWIERFQREARVCAKLKHPNIVSVYKLGEKDDYHYIVLEFVEGVSMKDLLSRAAPLPIRISLSITAQILEALTYIHQNNIIHRDVKPGNILIDTTGLVKLTDFGLAHLGDEVSVTVQGSIIGTPAYMAPEQVIGEALDGRTDIFSLGSVIYEMLTGKQAFGGESYSVCLHKIINEQPPPAPELNPRLPNEINFFLEKFLQKIPNERWKDAQQAHGYLQDFARENRIKLEQISIQGFIQPFLGTGSSSENHSSDREGSIRLRSITPWKLFVGFAAVIILLLVSVVWMGQQERASPKFANKQQSSTSTESDSGRTGFLLETRPESISSNEPAMEAEEAIGDEASNPTAQRSNLTQDGTDSLKGDSLNADRLASTAPSTANDVKIEDDLPAQLNISVEPWAKVMIDDQEIDSQTSQVNVPVAPGKHTVTFLHPNFPPYAMPLDIVAGEEKTIKWSFLKNAGFLAVEVRPWAEIYIDNQYRDSTPLENPIMLSSGKHLLELRHPQLSSYRDYITIEPEDTLRLQIVLKHE